MSISSTEALSLKLKSFRQWLKDEAKCEIHSALAIVNGEANDGTRGSPVLVTSRASEYSVESNGKDDNKKEEEEGLGRVDGNHQWVLWDRTVGCQIRATRDIKSGEMIFHIPRNSMVTPLLLQASDVGQALHSLIEDSSECPSSEWFDVFANTAAAVQQQMERLQHQKATQLLVTILRERKRAESLLLKIQNNCESTYPTACSKSVITTRAIYIAFLISQRFTEGNVISKDNISKLPEGAPNTFSPYAQCLPSGVSIPLCWKRNELALLSGCSSGFEMLKEVAAHTCVLSNELCALIQAGITKKFPELFPAHSISWDAWCWGCSMIMSRALPALTYFESESEGETFPHVWQEIGVMIPFLDMLNHEREANQITWDPSSSSSPYPKAVLHKRVRRGCQLYTNYGALENYKLIFDYGMAQIANNDDFQQVSWGLMDGLLLEKYADNHISDVEIKSWWNSDRLKLLQEEAAITEHIINNDLLQGKKLVFSAHRDGSFDQHFLAVAVVSTLHPSKVEKMLTKMSDGSPSSKGSVNIGPKHQKRLQKYLDQFYSSKLSVLISNINEGLNPHFKQAQIRQISPEDDADEKNYIGWETFFEQNAYAFAIDMEKRFYAMGSGSCVLALYDGYLKSIQNSINGLSDDNFSTLLEELKEIGYEISDASYEDDEEEEIVENGKSEVAMKTDETTDKSETTKDESSKSESKVDKQVSKTSKKSTSSGGPTIKLHIGNINYTTKADKLRQYFAKLYGEKNIVECRIPTERGSARSRGFGFVTLPENLALDALSSKKSFELEGRTLRVEKSNSSLGKSNRDNGNDRDRCGNCGYSQRFCNCYSRHGADPPLRERERGCDNPRGDGYSNGVSAREMDRRDSRSRPLPRSPSPQRYSRDYHRYRMDEYDRERREKEYAAREVQDHDRGHEFQRGRERYRDRSRERSVDRIRFRRREEEEAYYNREKERRRRASRSRSRGRSVSLSSSRRRGTERSSRRKRESDDTLDRAAPDRYSRSDRSKRKRSRSSSRRRSRSRSPDNRDNRRSSGGGGRGNGSSSNRRKHKKSSKKERRRRSPSYSIDRSNH